MNFKIAKAVRVNKVSNEYYGIKKLWEKYSFLDYDFIKNKEQGFL